MFTIMFQFRLILTSGFICLAMVTLILVIILLHNLISKGKFCKHFLQVFEERRNLLGKWVRHALTVKNAMFTLSYLLSCIYSIPLPFCPSLRSGQIASGNRCYKIFSPDVLLTSWNISDWLCAAGYQRKPLTSLESFPGSYPSIYFHS